MASQLLSGQSNRALHPQAQHMPKVASRASGFPQGPFQKQPSTHTPCGSGLQAKEPRAMGVVDRKLSHSASKLLNL